MIKKAHDKNLLLRYGVDGLSEETREELSAARSGTLANAQKLCDKRIWRIDDVAKFLGCSKGHVYNLSSDEKIPKIKKGKFLYFIPSEILEWLLQGDLNE